MEKTLGKQTHIKKIAGGGVGSPKGFISGGQNIGMRKSRPDMGWIYSEVPAETAGVYTTNRFQAAPLAVTREALSEAHKLQAVLVNTVSANSCTGRQGLINARTTRKWMAERLGIPEHYVGVASTGVIGMQLPMDKMKKGIDRITIGSAAASFAEAILTTDKHPKQLAVQCEIGGRTVTIGGACKGSGMIHPNMATMLAFVTTDANIAADDLHEALKHVTDQTFNRITVDGDTSTNDMVLVMANGKAGNERLSQSHRDWPVFQEGLGTVCRELAKQIAADGEGATKLIEVQVTGARDNRSAEVISKTIVGSNLVKAAIFGRDANWGRMICAAGYSGEPFDPEKVTLAIGDIVMFADGLPVPFNEEEAKNYLNQDCIVIKAHFGDGDGSAIAWGCDLTYDYVKINASYRS